MIFAPYGELVRETNFFNLNTLLNNLWPLQIIQLFKIFVFIYSTIWILFFEKDEWGMNGSWVLFLV